MLKSPMQRPWFRVEVLSTTALSEAFLRVHLCVHFKRCFLSNESKLKLISGEMICDKGYFNLKKKPCSLRLQKNYLYQSVKV